MFLFTHFRLTDFGSLLDKQRFQKSMKKSQSTVLLNSWFRIKKFVYEYYAISKSGAPADVAHLSRSILTDDTDLASSRLAYSK